MIEWAGLVRSYASGNVKYVSILEQDTYVGELNG